MSCLDTFAMLTLIIKHVAFMNSYLLEMYFQK